MAGRARLVPPHIVELSDARPPLLPPPGHVIDDRPLLRRLPPPPHPAIIALEDRLASQNREIHVLLSDNQHLAATHVALRQEVDASRYELRHAASAAARARAERDAELRQVLDLSARVETEARAVEEMRSEIAHVRADVQKLAASRNELLDRLQGLQGALVRAREEVGQASAFRAEIEAMNRELQRGRAAVEYEKNARSENLEQCQEMERNMISMAREVEKLRIEYANAEKRSRATAAASIAANQGLGNTDPYRNAGMAYGGNAYNVAYNVHQGADSSPHYGQVAGTHGGYSLQQTHANR